jgi:hypothetical protein
MRGCETFRKVAIASWLSRVISANCGPEKIERANCNFVICFRKQGTQIWSWASFRRGEESASRSKFLARKARIQRQNRIKNKFSILGMAIADPKTENLAFGVVLMCIRDRIEAIAPQPDDFSTILLEVIGNAVLNLREAAVSYSMRIAGHLPQSRSNTCEILFKALSRADQNRFDSVRRIVHAAMCQIASVELTNNIIKKALIDAIPQFFLTPSSLANKKFYTSASEFQANSSGVPHQV